MKSESFTPPNPAEDLKRVAQKALDNERAHQMLEQMSLLAGLPPYQLLLAYIRFLPDVIRAELEKRKLKNQSSQTLDS